MDHGRLDVQTQDAPAVDRLMAQVACTDVLLKFFACVDEGRAADAVELFTDDAELHNPGSPSLRGLAEIGAVFQKRQQMVDLRTCHSVSNVSFEHVSESSVIGRWLVTLHVLSAPNPLVPTALNGFADRFERGSDGRWQIASRTVTPIADSR